MSVTHFSGSISSSISASVGILEHTSNTTSESISQSLDSITHNITHTLSTGQAEDLKFFSRETHTIFPPKLEVEWDDSSWNTGSLSALSATDLDRLTVYFQNMKPEYKEKSKVKFRVETPQGKLKWQRESYLVAGESVTDVEATILSLIHI